VRGRRRIAYRCGACVLRTRKEMVRVTAWGGPPGPGEHGVMDALPGTDATRIAKPARV